MTQQGRTVAIVAPESELALITGVFAPRWSCVTLNELASEAAAAVDLVVVDETFGTVHPPDEGDPPATIRLVATSSEDAEERARRGELVVAKGPTARLQLVLLEKWMFASWHLKQLELTITRPFSHDVRGAIGVVQLATQLLQQTGSSSSTVQKLTNAGRRLSHLLEDLKVVVPLRLWGEVTLCFDGAWPKEVEQEVGHWGLSNRKRTFELDVDARHPHAYSTPHVVGIVMGAIDAAEKVIPVGEALGIRVQDDGKELTITVEGSNASAPEGLTRQLRIPVAEWDLAQPRDVSFRLLSAALLARQLEGKLDFEIENGKVRIRAAVPANAPHSRTSAATN